MESPRVKPSVEDAKWYHRDEPGIMDVTSFKGISKAMKDGRIDRIMEEHEKYMKETGRKDYELQASNLGDSQHRKLFGGYVRCAYVRRSFVGFLILFL